MVPAVSGVVEVGERFSNTDIAHPEDLLSLLLHNHPLAFFFLFLMKRMMLWSFYTYLCK